jgi:hypothetical protein
MTLLAPPSNLTGLWPSELDNLNCHARMRLSYLVAVPEQAASRALLKRCSLLVTSLAGADAPLNGRILFYLVAQTQQIIQRSWKYLNKV